MKVKLVIKMPSSISILSDLWVLLTLFRLHLPGAVKSVSHLCACGDEEARMGATFIHFEIFQVKSDSSEKNCQKKTIFYAGEHKLLSL